MLKQSSILKVHCQYQKQKQSTYLLFSQANKNKNPIGILLFFPERNKRVQLVKICFRFSWISSRYMIIPSTVQTLKNQICASLYLGTPFS